MNTGVSFDYSGAAVLITGGSNGIGLGIATAYRNAGADVVITGRKASVDDYDHDLSDFTYRQLDVDSQESLVELAGDIDKLDILVNNAGGVQEDVMLTLRLNTHTQRPERDGSDSLPYR